MEQFIIQCAGDVISVSSSVDGLAEITKRLISPPFRIENGTSTQATWKIEVQVANDEQKAFRNEHFKKDSVRLVMSPGDIEYVISDYSQEMIRLYTLPSPTMGWFAIESYLENRKWVLYMELENENSLRWLSRMVKLYFGSLFQSRGYKFFHASGVSINKKGILFVGGGKSGKSSLMYLTCSHLRASFLSDDIVVLWIDGDGQLQSIGWPKRIALGLSLLKNEPLFERVKRANLRRSGLDYSLPKGILSYEWSRANRVAFDQDEFLNLFGFNSISTSTPALIVFANANRNMSGWDIQRVKDDEACVLLKKNFASSIHLKYMTDYLGLIDHKAKKQGKSYIESLISLPLVKVFFGDAISRRFYEFWKEILNVSKFYA